MQMSQYISDLSGKKLEKAQQIRTATMEIVQDALEKQFYGFPVSFNRTCSIPDDPYKFCSIPTKSFLQDLLEKLEEVKFKEDTDPEMSDIFAYVIPGDMDDIVYLCECFWGALDNLPCEYESNNKCFDSKPGTLIHEVSHLLGTEDITYDRLTVQFWEYEFGRGFWMGTCLVDEEDVDPARVAMYVVQINANSLEHEYETIINHERSYQDGKYLCCGETRINSVCKSRSILHYGLHNRPEFDKFKKEMEESLQKHKQKMLLNMTQRIRYEKIRNSACKKTCMPLK